MSRASAAASSPVSDHLKCGICEEDYNESNRLPKMFPCQHSVCLKCMEGMIEKCDGEELTCPLCRHSTPIPEFGAAGFPNNLTIMSLLSVTSSQQDAPSRTCPQHPGKEVSVFCVTCRQAVCATCMIKSAEHKSHEMEELADAMEKCIQEGKEVLDVVVNSLMAYQRNIEKKARAGNPDCWKILAELQSYMPGENQWPKEDSDNVSSVESDPDCGLDTTCELPDPVLEPAVPAILPKIRWSRPVENTSLKPLLSVVLPDFKHIEINRKNTILMTHHQNHYEVYEMHNHSYRKVEESSSPAKMCDYEAERVLLSHQNEVVVQEKIKNIKISTSSKTYNLHDKDHPHVATFHGDWFVVTSQLEDRFVCKIMHAEHAECIGMVTGSGVLQRVVPLTGHTGIMIVYCEGSSDRSNKKVYAREITVFPNGAVNADDQRKIGSVEKLGAAVIRPQVCFLEDNCTISIYSIQATKVVSYSSSVTRLDFCKNDHPLTLRDLGLPADSSIQNIWAGDLDRNTQVLHVLYTSSVHQHVLASYTVAKDGIA